MCSIELLPRWRQDPSARIVLAHTSFAQDCRIFLGSVLLLLLCWSCRGLAKHTRKLSRCLISPARGSLALGDLTRPVLLLSRTFFDSLLDLCIQRLLERRL